jgi:hypothetical protein
MMRAVPAKDFWNFADVKSDDICWPWIGPVTSNGYGQSHWKSAPDPKAHRSAYILRKGLIPCGYVIRHTCDNKICVNPNHLVVGTYSDNAWDASDRGQLHKGEKHKNAKLRATEVVEMRSLFVEGVRKSELARKFGVSFMNVSHIVARRIWRHI